MFMIGKKSFIILGAILCSIMILFCIFKSSISAKENKEFDNLICSYLVANHFDMTSKYSVSQGYPLTPDGVGYGTARIYFIFENDKYIGELTVSNLGSTFFLDNCDFITDIKNRDDAICIVQPDQNNIFVATESSGNFLLAGIPGSDLDIDTKEIAKEKIILEPVYVDDRFKTIMESKGVEENDFNVPYISNAVAPDSGYGLCWVASVLSMLNYKLGSTGYTDAISLYNYFELSYVPTPGHPYPEGYASNIIALFNSFGVTVYHGAYGASCII